MRHNPYLYSVMRLTESPETLVDPFHQERGAFDGTLRLLCGRSLHIFFSGEEPSFTFFFFLVLAA